MAKLRPDAEVSPGDTFWFSVAVMVNDDTIYVGQLDVTVAESFTEELFNAVSVDYVWDIKTTEEAVLGPQYSLRLSY